jgi:hypothetical protein
MLRRSIGILLEREKLPILLDNQIVHRNNSPPSLKSLEEKPSGKTLDVTERGCQRAGAPSLTWPNALTVKSRWDVLRLRNAIFDNE